MISKISKPTIFLMISLLLILVPLNVAADPTRISQGNTIFIGEQGLDISSAIGADTKIGWWASAASISGSAPSQTMAISSPANFYVTSSAFSEYTGNWYRINNAGQEDGLAFNVQDPQLAVRVIDDTLNLDRTNDWFPTGDFARFAIDSNLDVVTSQRGLGAPVTIRVFAPDGGEYSSLIGPGGSGSQSCDQFTHYIKSVFYTLHLGYRKFSVFSRNLHDLGGVHAQWNERQLSHFREKHQ